MIVKNGNNVEVVSFKIPDTVPIDLQTKFVVCAIRLRAFHLLDELLKPLLEYDDIELIGDLYLDVVETLVAVDQNESALKLLIPLVKKTKNYSLPAVWLKYADCLRACSMYEQAVDAYTTVMQMAPFHAEVSCQIVFLIFTCTTIFR